MHSPSPPPLAFPTEATLDDMTSPAMTFDDSAPQASGTPGPQKPTVSLLVNDLSRQGEGRWGGSRPFLLAQALQRAGYGVEILGFTDDNHIATIQAAAPVCALRIPSFHWRWSAVGELLSRLRGDIIYAHKLKPSSFGIALLHRLRHRRPVVVDIDDWELSWHGGEDWQYRPGPRQLARDLLKPRGALHEMNHPFYLRQMENLVSYADRITTHNSFLQGRFGGTYVANGKDVAAFDPQRHDPAESRRRYGLADYRVVMFPGAPRPYKGVEDLLQAVASLNQPDLRVVMVGGSPYDDYDQQLQRRWGQWLISLPQTPAEEMPAVIAAAHVVAVPQRQHPAALAQFPLKLTDGMAMAKPVLATRVGDMPQILADTGYLAAPDNPADLAAQLGRIFADWPQAEAQGQRARERCCQHYSLEAMATQLDQLFTGLVGQHP